MKRRSKNASFRAQPSSGAKSALDWLPSETVVAINRTIARRFSRLATEQVTDMRWSRYVGEGLDARRPFEWAYSDLLTETVEGHADLLTEAILASRSRHKPVHWLEIAATSVQFVERFAEKECVNDWLAQFLEHQQHMQDPQERPDWRLGWATIVSAVELPEVQLDWKSRAIEKAKYQIQLRVLIAAGSPGPGEKNGPAILDFETIEKTRSFREAQAAHFFECTAHTIQRWVREGKLTRASKGRIKNDLKFLTALNEFHGIPPANR